MRSHFKWSRKLRRAGLASLLVGAALVLSGCWATVYKFSDGTRNITLTEDFTRRLISSCGDEHGNGSARTFCVLDRINGVCYHIPAKGITQNDCYPLSSYGNWESMDVSIENVIGSSDCLSFFEDSINGNFWGSVTPGVFGCK